MRQNNQDKLNSGTGAKGEALRAAARETEAHAANADPERPAAMLGPSMEAVIERENLRNALARVKRNKGAGGVDRMSVDELPAYLKEVRGFSLREMGWLASLPQYATVLAVLIGTQAVVFACGLVLWWRERPRAPGSVPVAAVDAV